MVRRWVTLSVALVLTTLPLAAQDDIFADDFETGGTSRWSETVGLIITFELGHRSMTWVDPSRSNRSVPAEVYYPATTAGDEVPFAAGAFPVVVCGHGFMQTADSPLNVAEVLVPGGYIVALPATETGFPMDHLDFGLDVGFVAQSLEAEGASASSPFFGHVGDRLAAAGHSAGGGAAHLAASSFPGLFHSIATMAAARTDPDSVAAAQSLTIPALYLADDRNCALEAGGAPVDHYNASGASCKALLTILDGLHCSYVYPNFWCTSVDCSSGIDPELQRQIVADYLRPWLDWVLKNDAAALASFDALASSDPRLASYQQEGCVGESGQQARGDDFTPSRTSAPGPGPLATGTNRGSSPAEAISSSQVARGNSPSTCRSWTTSVDPSSRRSR